MTYGESDLPVAIIGAGPIGLATAANLIERGITPLIFEKGDAAGATIRSWGHIRLFSAWEHNIDPAARRLLEPTDWTEPRLTSLPFGEELVEKYLEPLAAIPAISSALHTSSTVTAVSRVGTDKTHSRTREDQPFLVRVKSADGKVTDHLARAVVDTSGTWYQPNPLGQGGLSAPGEMEAIEAGLVTSPLPDITGNDRHRFSNKHVLVVGSGHSAANTLINLGQLAKNDPTTRITWAVRGSDASRLYGGGDSDGLPARGQLGTRLRQLVETRHITLHTSFTIASLTTSEGVKVTGSTPTGPMVLNVDLVVPATGFRPDLTILREIRLEVDPIVEAPRDLAPLIDPEFHSCGTVPAHGAKTLAHPEKDFYIAGIKSYGRAPTFLLATGYEQVRSIVASLAGDHRAANQVYLELPETGVCSTDLGGSRDLPSEATPNEAATTCCATPKPVLIGIPTGLTHGRSE